MKRIFFTVIFILTLILPAEASVTLADKFGAAHTAGNYYFTNEPFLIEGAKQIKSLGSNVIKVFLQHPSEAYSYNSKWSSDIEIPNIIDVLKTEYFQELFEMDFSTFILQTHENTYDGVSWWDSLTDDEWWKIEENYYNAAIYLFRKYSGRKVKFILEHWETDGYYQILMNQVSADKKFNTSVMQQGLKDYFNARAEGVKRARNQAFSENINGVEVLTAIEIIYTKTPTENTPAKFRVIDNMDEYRADLIAYSMNLNNHNMEEMLNSIENLIKKSGGRKWYFGEFSSTESMFNPFKGYETLYDTAENISKRQEKTVLNQADIAFKMGAEYVIIWEIYHNENESNATNMNGYGLIRADGSKTALAKDMPEILKHDSIPINMYIGKDFIESLSPNSNFSWFYTDDTHNFARGAEVEKLTKNITNLKGQGLILHTSRVAGGRVGDSYANAGERVSLWIDSYGRMSNFLMQNPKIPTPETSYSDDNFQTRAFTKKYKAPSISTSKIKDGNYDKTYSFTFKANGSKPLKWFSSGLPDGFILNEDTGKITGKTQLTGKFPVRISVSNSVSSDTKIYELFIKATAPKITANLKKGKAFELYESQFSATGTKPIIWTLEVINGKLPDGISFDSENAILGRNQLYGNSNNYTDC